MTWQILTTKTFDDWLFTQPIVIQEKILAHLCLLAEYGASLGRPYADTINGSDFANMKELRIQIQGEPYRAFYAFDPKRQAIILCCGNKAHDKRFYQTMIALADDLYQKHLDTLE
ncbi:hypothetical protein SAMN02745664_1307 [Moraxella cuniculi DSM 21768]|uniref:Type II toxin-antitoxin system RelE/ParE family toxin n=1 Tax=Moraxella cuniculi DSM 21768 TaxID=1122245 RepID=A0A1N7GB15_9GAMM|nr:type II toxin-antitoxin system RelE/ParE family toxin [Moraxella cuniculi]SIS09747.1 hypothetical protein SAMN02745664_1307 [Moraxella cuniculi DSM 21768]